VSSLAVQLASTLYRDLALRRVMVIGAGEAAAGALKSLHERGVRDIVMVNRSAEHLAELVSRFEATTITLLDIGKHLHECDIVLSSTAAPHIILDAATIAAAVKLRKNRPLLLIDLAIPRDIETGAAQIKGVHLYDLDYLQHVATANRARRTAAITAAKAIVKEEVALFLRQQQARAARQKRISV